jgi:hypothetical protein
MGSPHRKGTAVSKTKQLSVWQSDRAIVVKMLCESEAERRARVIG